MKLSLLTLCCVISASLPDTEGIFHGNHRSFVARTAAHNARFSAADRSGALSFNQGLLGMGSARAGRGGKGKIFRSILSKLKDIVKKQAKQQRKDPEIPDPPAPRNDRDRDNRRPDIERTGPFGRENKRPGSTGREIEGAFHGDRTGAVVRHVPSTSNRRDRNDRDRGGPRGSNDRGRSHRERGAHGRSIEH